jgi:hypothetical protein
LILCPRLTCLEINLRSTPLVQNVHESIVHCYFSHAASKLQLKYCREMLSVGSFAEYHRPYRILPPSHSNRDTWSSKLVCVSNSRRPPHISSEQKFYAHQHTFPNIMEPINSDDMEAFQRLSDQYQPDVQVGVMPFMETTTAESILGPFSRQEIANECFGQRV